MYNQCRSVYLPAIALSLTLAYACAVAQGPLKGEKVGPGGSFGSSETKKRTPKPFVPRDELERQAVKKSLEYLAKLGIKLPDDASIEVVKATNVLVAFNPYAAVTVDAKATKAITIDITEDMVELLRNRPGFARANIVDPINLRGYINRIAKLVGVPDNYKISSIRDFSATRPSVKDLRVSLNPMPYGHSIEGYEECSMFINKQAGIVTCISLHHPGKHKYEIESHDARLTFDQAKTTAEPIAKKYQVGKYRKNEFEYQSGSAPRPNKLPSALEYVCPNGRFEGLDYGFPAVLKLRLAWRLRYPRNEEIWIDAGDGKVLGGFYRDKP